MSRLPSPLRWFGARLWLFAATLLVLELGLGELGAFGKWTVQEQSARYGWRMLPDQRAWSRDLDVEERINTWGFRDERDWAPPTGARDAGLLRVAVVGNSMTYGTSVPVEETWPRVLEGALDAELERRGDSRRALVMNFAVQGYTFEQMARLYDDVIAPWRPDLLVWPSIAPDVRPMAPAQDDAEYRFRRLVLRTALHDFLRREVTPLAPVGDAVERPDDEDDARRLLGAAYDRSVRAALAEHFAPERAEALFERYAGERDALLSRSEPELITGRLFRAVERVLPDDASGRQALLTAWTAMEAAIPARAWEELDREFKRGPFKPRFRFLWSARMLRLTELARRLEAQGGRLVLMALPTTPRLVVNAPSPLVRWDSEWLPTALVEGLTPHVFDALEPFVAPMATLVDTIRSRGYVDGPRGDEIGPDFPGVEDCLFLLDDPGHYNARGHALLGATVAQRLIADGLIDSGLNDGGLNDTVER